MDNIGTLMSVVSRIDTEAKHLNYILDNEDYPLTYEEEYGLKCSIRTLEELSEYFQDAIEAAINAYEISQGM